MAHPCPFVSNYYIYIIIYYYNTRKRRKGQHKQAPIRKKGVIDMTSQENLTILMDAVGNFLMIFRTTTSTERIAKEVERLAKTYC